MGREALSTAQATFVTSVRPILAHLVNTLLDARRRERQREQLESLSLVAAALPRDQGAAEALDAVATALAKASGFDWAPLMLVDERVERLTSRVINRSRYSETETAVASREAAYIVDWALGTARYLNETRRPLLYPRMDAAEHERPFPPDIQRYLARAHILSGAVLPLVAGGRLLGTLNLSACTPHRFQPAEVQSLTLLAEQAVLAIEWLQVHRELREANAALARAATHLASLLTSAGPPAQFALGRAAAGAAA